MSSALPPGENDLLDDGPVVSDLGRSVVGGGVLALASQGVRFALRTAGVVVMARLLMPDDFGVYVMATSLTMFAALFEDFGLTKATVQSPRVTQAQVSTLFWINAGLGLGLALIVAAAAPLLAHFYGEPRVWPITTLMALPLFLAGLSAQHEALLERRLRIRDIETMSILSHLSGAAVMYFAAWKGAGYWALALNILVMRVVMTGSAWWFTGWRPGLPSRGSGVEKMLSFGKNLSGYYIVNFFNRNLDNVLLGRTWGPLELGYYSKAYGLLRQPYVQMGGPVSSDIVPALSRLQDDPARYRRYFLLGAQAVATLAAPCVLFTYADASEVVLALLGAKWLPVVPLFRALAPAALLSTTSMTAGWLYQSSGRTDRMFKSAACVLAVLVVAFTAGLPWGAHGVALAYSGAYCLLFVPVNAYALAGTPVALRDFVGAVWRPFLFSLLAGASTLAFKAVVGGPQSPLARLVLDGLFYAAAYAALWLALPGGREALQGLSRPVLKRAKEIAARKLGR